MRVTRLAVGFGAMVGLMLASAQLAAGAVSVGHSGWSWGDPRPQGNTLLGLDFAGPRGYAAGEFGTLLRTDDSGESWTGVPTGLTDPLVDVRAVDANTVVIGGQCALRRSDDGGQSFTRLPWTSSDDECPSPIASFSFPTAETGYVMTTDGSVFRTADGGQTFSRKTSVPGTGPPGAGSDPTDIYFTGADAGVASTGASGSGKLFRTTNGGDSWTEVASTARPLRGMTFTAGGIGYAVGDATTMLRSTDSGATWDPKPLAGVPGNLALRSIDCADGTTCLATEASGGRLVRTANGGDTAASVTASTQNIFAAAFSSAARAIAVGNRGATVRSDDGGETWSPIGGSIAGSQFSRLRANSPLLASAAGADGTVARTTDGGATWSTVGVPTTHQVVDASFPSESLGLALDAAGEAFKSQNGGESWQILSTGASSTPNALATLSPTVVLLVGPKGIRRSADGGGAFDAIGAKKVRQASLFDADSAGGGVAFAWGAKTLLATTDSGESWKKLKLPPKGARLEDVDFVSRKLGYAQTRDSKVWKTTNGGRKWKDVPAIGTDSGTGISFSSPTSGYMAAFQLGDSSPFGYAYRTTDGGKSWQPQLISQAPVQVQDAGSTAFALNTPGSVTPNGDPIGTAMFATTSGGQAGSASKLTLKKKKGGKSSAGDASAAKATRLTVAGTLSPAEGGERVVVSIRKAKSSSQWNYQNATAASNGAFTARFKVRKPSFVVAQWQGDDDRAGAGSRVVKLTPKKSKKKGKGKKSG